MTEPLRLGGLASGMDTESVISQLMAVEKLPQQRLQQQQTLEQARQQDLKDIQTRVGNLQTAAQALTDPSIWADTQTVDTSDPSHLSVTRTAGAPPGGYLVEVQQLARAAQSTSASLSTAPAGGTLTIQVGSGAAKDVTVNAGDSLQTLADRINGTTDMGVYASVSNGKLVLSGKTTGSASTIAVTGSAAAGFGFTQTMAPQNATVVVGDTVGSDGHISGGTTLSESSNIVSDAIPGVSITLRGTTPLGSPAGVTVGEPAPDTSAITNAIQSFVTQYNSTVDFIQSKLNEQTVNNPQSDSDRAKGDLQGDPGLSSLLTQMRQAFSTPMAGRPSLMSMLSQAGLSTGAPTGSAAVDQDAIDGKLSLDTSKLSDALAGSFSDVKALFTNSTGSYGSEGVGQRLATLLNGQLDGNTGALTLRISSEQGTIDDLGKQIDAWNDRLSNKETQLRNQFTAMETALSQSQSLQSALASQIASLPSVG